MGTSAWSARVACLLCLVACAARADESLHRGFLAPPDEGGSDEPVSASRETLRLPGKNAGAGRGPASVSPARNFRSTGQRGAYRPPSPGRGANPEFSFTFRRKDKDVPITGERTNTLLRTVAATSSATVARTETTANVAAADSFFKAATAGSFLGTVVHTGVGVATLAGKGPAVTGINAAAGAKFSAIQGAYAAIAGTTSTTEPGTMKVPGTDGKLKDVPTVVTKPGDPAAMTTAMGTLVRTLGAKDAAAVFREAAEQSGDAHTKTFVKAYSDVAANDSVFSAASTVMKLRASDPAGTAYTTTAAAAAFESRQLALRDTFTNGGQRLTGDETTSRLLAASTPQERAEILTRSLRMNTDEYGRLMNTPREQLSESDRARRDILESKEGRAAWAAGGESARKWQGERARLFGEEGKETKTPDAEEAYRALLGPAKGKGGSTSATVTDYLGMRLNDKGGAGMREFRDIAHAASGGTGKGSERYLVFEGANGVKRTMPLTGNPKTDGDNFRAMTAAGLKLQERYQTEKVPVKDAKGNPVIGADGKPVTRTTFKRDSDGNPIENPGYKETLAERGRLNEALATARKNQEEADGQLKTLKADLEARTTRDPVTGEVTGTVGDENERFRVQLAVAKAEKAATEAKTATEDADKAVKDAGAPPTPPATAGGTPPPTPKT